MNGNNAINQLGSGDGVNGSGGTGNNALNNAFDHAISEASQTLSLTTKKGADLYALKQRPQ